MSANMPDPNGLKDWYAILKERFPVAALGMPGLAIGLFLLFISASTPPEIRPFVMWTGVVMMAAGATAYVLSILVAILRR